MKSLYHSNDGKWRVEYILTEVDGGIGLTVELPWGLANDAAARAQLFRELELEFIRRYK